MARRAAGVYSAADNPPEPDTRRRHKPSQAQFAIYSQIIWPTGGNSTSRPASPSQVAQRGDGLANLAQAALLALASPSPHAKLALGSTSASLRLYEVLRRLSNAHNANYWSVEALHAFKRRHFWNGTPPCAYSRWSAGSSLMPFLSLSRPYAPTKIAWLAAAFLASIAVALRAFLQPALGDELPFVIAAPVCLFCALMWGAGPGVVATLICLSGALLPSLSPDILNRDGGVKALVFSLVMAVACILIGRVDALRRRAEPLMDVDATPVVRWLSAALIGAVLVPATAFIVAGWWTYERATTASHTAAIARADLVHEHAQRTFDVAEKLTTQAASLTNISDEQIRFRETEIRQRLSDMLLGVPAVVNLNVWNAEAVPLARSDRAIDPLATVADRDYFRRQASQDRGFDVSEVLIGRQTGRELFNLTHWRPSANGVFTGIIAVSISPEHFRDYYRAIVAQNTDLESIGLVRTDGKFLARWPLAASGVTGLPANAASLSAIRRGEISGVVYGKVNGVGEERVAAFRRLEDLPVYVIVSFSRSTMLAGWVRTMGLVGAIALPLALMLIGVTAMARRRVQSEQHAQLELHDQTRLMAATEKSALEAHRRETLATLTAGVAHDFNNLLAILSNSLHIQHVKHPDQASEPQNAAMRRAVQSGTRLTRQLLSFTRRQTLRPEVVDLQTWLPEMQELLRTTLGARIGLTLTVEPGLPPVLVDSAELELALVNLAVNSKYAQPNGGSFALAARIGNEVEGSWVLLSATDEGTGIPQDILNRVTEPFFTTKEPGSGSGLGLNQVRGVVEAAGGQLRIESEVDRGTTVKLIFPAFKLATSVAETPVSDQPTSHREKFNGHVLLAEDNDDVAAVTSALISSLGLRVTRANNALEALEILQTSGLGDNIGFLLTDVVMPGEMDGVQLATKVRAERPTLHVTVITGFTENAQAAQDAGLDLVHKPLDLDELVARLRKAFPAS